MFARVQFDKLRGFYMKICLTFQFLSYIAKCYQVNAFMLLQLQGDKWMK